MKLADIESIEKRLTKKNKDKNNDNINQILEKSLKLINSNKDLNEVSQTFDDKYVKMAGLLCLKPKLFVCNVDEQSIASGNNYTKKFINKFGEKNTVIISAEIENQINQLSKDEKNSYMKILNIKETGLNNLIKKGYELLKIETFFTSGSEESRAWTIKKNCTAPEAAGEIHSDFQKGFIRAETVSFDDFVDCNGWLEAKNKGKMRLEGKDYLVCDGDILNFRFNT